MSLRWMLGLLVWSLALIASADAPMFRASGNAVPDEYIVVFRDPFATRLMAARMQDEIGGEVMGTFEQALAGAHVRMTEDQARRTMQMRGVRWIEENAEIVLFAPISQQAPGNAGLDRIDERSLPTDGSYRAPASGAGVNIYVVDTGINPGHVEFGGRARVGADFAGDGRNGIDCNGHGTHVAGIAGSRAFGVAKDANLIGVRVFTCDGRTSTANVIAGVDWVVRNAVRPAVANLSLGGGASRSLDTAVATAVGAGIFVAVAAGNSNRDACGGSPARAPEAFAVGSSQIDDQRSGFSNFGRCVRLFAPGSQIRSTWFRSPTDTNVISGTSMASPHVAGAAALLLEQDRGLAPGEVGRRLLDAATPGVIRNPGAGSPNLLLFTGGVGAPPVMQMPFVERFENGPGAFAYRDDVFGTNAPAYASGVAVTTGGTGNSGALRVRLGGVDNATVTNMSGGFAIQFQLAVPAQVELRFTYNVTQSPNYEADETTTGAVLIDNVVADTFGRIAGNGNGGGAISTGLQSRTVALGSLGAGPHTVVIGLFNNKKTLADESSDLIIDDVSIAPLP